MTTNTGNIQLAKDNEPSDHTATPQPGPPLTNTTASGANAHTFGSTKRLHDLLHDRLLADASLYTSPHSTMGPVLPLQSTGSIQTPERRRELEKVYMYGFPPQAGEGLLPRSTG